MCVWGGGGGGGGGGEMPMLDGLGAHFTVLFDKTGQHHHSFPTGSVITQVYILMQGHTSGSVKWNIIIDFCSTQADGRPARRAASSVCYKEPSLNV